MTYDLVILTASGGASVYVKFNVKSLPLAPMGVNILYVICILWFYVFSYYCNIISIKISSCIKLKAQISLKLDVIFMSYKNCIVLLVWYKLLKFWKNSTKWQVLVSYVLRVFSDLKLFFSVSQYIWTFLNSYSIFNVCVFIFLLNGQKCDCCRSWHERIWKEIMCLKMVIWPNKIRSKNSLCRKL